MKDSMKSVATENIEIMQRTDICMTHMLPSMPHTIVLGVVISIKYITDAPNSENRHEKWKLRLLQIRLRNEMLLFHGLVDRICSDLDIELILPIWNRNSEQTITDFIDAGFEMIVVSAKTDLFDKEVLGQKIDK